MTCKEYRRKKHPLHEEVPIGSYNHWEFSWGRVHWGLFKLVTDLRVWQKLKEYP